MLLYFSFKFQENSEDLITTSSHFVLSALQGYAILLESNKKKEAEEQRKEVMNLGLNFISQASGSSSIFFKYKNKKMSLNEMNEDDLFFINNYAKDKYSLKDLPSILYFFKEIIIKKDIDKEKFKNKEELNLTHLCETIMCSKSICKVVKGFLLFEKKCVKIKISHSKVANKNYLFIHIDEEDLNNQIETLKEINLNTINLLAKITHDLKSPLNGIMAFIGSSQESSDENEKNTFLEYAKVSSELLLSLINDILDSSSFANNSLRVTREPFHLVNVINEVIALMKVQTDLKKITFKLRLKINENLMFYSDHRRIKQILINLLSNSIKFTLSGFIKLKIQPTKYDKIYQFSVIDTGVGISPDNIKKIFNPYSSFDDEKKLNRYGLGLGLNLCKNLLSRLGPYDDFLVFSKIGVGTRINFFLYSDLDQRQRIPFFTNINLANLSSSILDKREKMLGSDSQTQNENVEKNKNGPNIKVIRNRDEVVEKNMVRETFIPSLERFKSISSLSHSDILEKEEILAKFSENQSVNEQFLSSGDYSMFENFQIKRKINFLILDNNSFSSAAIIGYLKKSGIFSINYEVATNGEECLNIFKRKNYISQYDEEIENTLFKESILHFIIIDSCLSIMNGHEITLKIKELISTKKYYGAFFLGILNNCTKEDEEKCLNFGMDGTLIMPVSESQLWFKINEIFKRKSHLK